MRIFNNVPNFILYLIVAIIPILAFTLDMDTWARWLLISIAIASLLTLAIIHSLKINATESSIVKTKRLGMKDFRKYLGENKKFVFDENKYTKTVSLNDRKILMTYNLKHFWPIKGSKKGKKLKTYEEVILYLKRVQAR